MLARTKAPKVLIDLFQNGRQLAFGKQVKLVLSANGLHLRCKTTSLPGAEPTKNSVFFLITFSFAPVVSKEKVGKEFPYVKWL